MGKDDAGWKGVAIAAGLLVLVFGICLTLLACKVLSGPLDVPTEPPVEQCPEEDLGATAGSTPSANGGEGIAGPPSARLFVLSKPGGQAPDGTAGEIDHRTLMTLRDQLRDIADQLLVPIEVQLTNDDADEEVLNQIGELLGVLSQRLSPPAEAQQPAGEVPGR